MPVESAVRHFHAETPHKSALPGSKCNWTTSLEIARCFRRRPNPHEPNPAQDPTSDFCICRVGRSSLPFSRRLMLSRALPDSSDVPFPSRVTKCNWAITPKVHIREI